MKKLFVQVAFNLLTRFRSQSNRGFIIYNDWIGFNIIVFGFYENEQIQLIKDLISDETISYKFIDVGSNIGNHTLFFSKIFKEVHSFEPQRKTFKVLELNTINIDNISLYNFGLGNQNKKIMFKVPIHNNGSANQSANSDDYFLENVEIRNFDELNIDKLGFVKIDVEGNEMSVLNGMKESILKSLPIISFEINENNNLHQRKEIIEFLNSIGYKSFYCLDRKNIPRRLNSKITRLIKMVYINLFNVKLKPRILNDIEIFDDKNNYSLILTYNTSSIHRLNI